MSFKDSQRYRKVYSYYRPVPRQTDTFAVDNAYIDEIFRGWDWKQSVRCATTGNINFVNPGTIDGVTLNDEDRVLVKNQTLPEENGIYIYYTSLNSLVRTLDATQDTLTSGACCYVEEGTQNQKSAWILTTQDPITVGTTGQTWVKFGASSIFSVNGTQATTVYSASFGGLYPNQIGTDVFFFVSGTIGGKDSVTGSIAAFGGDVVVSGNIDLYGELDFIGDGPDLEISASSVIFEGNWISADEDLFFSANGQMFSLASAGEQTLFDAAFPGKTIIGAILELTGARSNRWQGSFTPVIGGVSGSTLNFGSLLGMQMSSASFAAFNGNRNNIDVYVNGLRQSYLDDYEILDMHTLAVCFSYNTSTKFYLTISDAITYP